MRKDTKKGLWWTAAAAALATGIAGMSSPALAQTQAPADDEEEQAQQGGDGSAIVVTGSRIRRNEFTSASPVQIITSEQTTLEGLIDTSEILQGSSVAAGSQQINNQYTGFITEGGPGVNTVSLRGLGATRSLVLLNGRRLNPAGTRGQTGAVDLNVIPESIIERIEILKDGASSIYGSDAVAGVVNLITRTNLDGGVIGGQANLTFDGGGESYQIDGAWGQVFDRGQWMASFEIFQREELTWGDREHFSCSQDLVREGTGATTGGPAFGQQGGRVLDIIDPLTGQSKCFNTLENVIDRLGTNFFTTAGRFVPSTTAVAGGGPFGLDLNGWQRVGLTYAQVSSLFPVGTPTATIEAAWRASQAAVPTNPTRFNTRSAVSPATRYTLFFQGAYDLLPSMEVYGEALWNRRESEQNSWRQLFPNVSAANPNNPFGVTSRPIALVPTNGEQEVDTYRVVVGARGDLPFINGWSYDLYAQYGYADGTYTNDIIPNDRVLATTGAAGCTTTGITNISGYNCASVPTGVAWFNPSWITNGVLPAGQQEFIFTRESGSTTYEQQVISGVVSGDVFELPAGMLAAALGFEWRQEEIDDTPGLNARNNNLWGQTSAGRTAGSDTVRELFAEVEVPLLAGLPGIEELTFNGSYRWTDYDSYGENDTYKVAVNWQITPEYRIRATRGTSYRAPALYELFLANQTGFLGQANVDPCINWQDSGNPQIRANCAAAGIPTGYNAAGASSALIITGGGAGVLDPETSDAETLGFVWTPNWINFSLAIDYFSIEVNDQVAQFGAANILGACYGSANFPNDPFCTLFTRNGPTLSAGGMAPFGIISVNNSYVNLNSQVTEGIDVTLRFEHEFSFGTLTVNSSHTFTSEDSIDFFVGTDNDFNGEVFNPDAVGSLSFRFDRGDWTYFWDIDYTSKASNTEEFGRDVFAGWRGTPSSAYYKQYTEFTATHDASIRYRSDDWVLQAGIQNVFDEAPPSISFASGSTRIGNTPAFGNYDVIGRRGFISVSRRF